MSFIHGRLEVDARTRPDAARGEADGHLERCIQSLTKVTSGIDFARESGDFEFGTFPATDPLPSISTYPRILGEKF